MFYAIKLLDFLFNSSFYSQNQCTWHYMYSNSLAWKKILIYNVHINLIETILHKLKYTM